MPAAAPLLPPPSNTRLVTIVAHVDHGKTTLADSLCQHNGIISERLAGTMRYLDSMEEEQRRGITIRSSAIGLKHRRRHQHQHQHPIKNTKKNTTDTNTNTNSKNNNNSISKNASNDNDMVIHLIDSPGHVDFSMEVSSALQICDGAILVVDVVEGMCARTQSILREAHSQRLVPILVLNKIDRLCSDLGLTVNESYLRIRNVVENVNAAASAMISSANAQKKDGGGGGDGDGEDSNIDIIDGAEDASEDDDDEQDLEEIWNFDPVLGNVVFTTALYGWGFTIPSLARALFKSKTVPNVKPPIMRQYLFGDFKYRTDNGKIIKWKPKSKSSDNGESHNTMFAEYGLKPLWDIMTGVSTAQTSLGLESVLFGGAQYQQYQNHSHNQNEQQNKARERNVKIKATTVGMADAVMDALQIGCTQPTPTGPAPVPSSVQGRVVVVGIPQTIEEMQLILNKTTASSEEAILRALLRRHRPLSDAILDAVCDVCPSPQSASRHFRKRALALVDRHRHRDRKCVAVEEAYVHVDESSEDRGEFDTIRNAVRECAETNEDGTTPTVAHCCKFISTDRAHINDPELFSYLDSTSASTSTSTNLSDGMNSSIILGVARVLSGTLCSKDVEYYCFGPKHKASTPSQEHVPKRTIRLYLLMGSTYVRVNTIPAGHICAIHGLEELQLKTVTLCSSEYGMPLNSYVMGLRPLVKVNVEAVSNSDTAILERGLAKLSLADAAIEVTATAKGERILACLGEIHLEQSIIDLRKVYIGNDIELRISKPIVDFRESTAYFENEIDDFKQFYKLETPPLRQTCMPPYSEEDGLGYARSGRSRPIVSGRGMALHIRVLPLARHIHACLTSGSFEDACTDDLNQLAKALNLKEDSPENKFAKILELVAALDSNGNAIIESVGMQNGSCVKGVVCRPKEPKEIYVRSAASADIEETNESKEEKESSRKDGDAPVKTDIAKEEYEDIKRMICEESAGTDEEMTPRDSKTFKVWKGEFKGSLIGGFQSGCTSGPLCEEPVRGVLVVLEGVEIAMYERRKKTGTEDDFNIAKPMTGGMVVAALRTGIRTALLTRPARLMEGYLRLTLHSSLTGLGPLYEVLSRRRGKVLADTMVEGTDLISIEATLPQSESFGLTSELMKKSSGDVTAPELVFSHWEMLEEDPFWIPTSLEEREDYGEIVMNGDISTGVANNALKFIRLVRNRKGLIVDSHKIVVAAEKQRTLARKK